MAAPLAGMRAWVAEAEEVDRAVYAAVAETPTPLLDGAMRRLSNAADHSKLSIAASAMLAVAGGSSGRRAARTGLASVAVTSALVNLVVKRVGRRPRPDRDTQGVPTARHVPMPTSASFPSGHSAAAVAFASGASSELPAAAVPLFTLAATVAYSRIHTGVHYPGDVIAGATIGAVVAELTSGAISRTSRTQRSPGCRPSWPQR